MIYIINFLTLSVFSFLTLSFFPHLKIFGVAPLLSLFFIIGLAYFRKGFEPLFLAAVFGILFDINSAYPFGFYLTIFLIAVGTMRYMFQEGMKTFSFASFLLISFVALLSIIVLQVIFVAIDKTSISVLFILPILAFVGVNMVYAILIYAFSNWYFEKIQRLEHKLRRR